MSKKKASVDKQSPTSKPTRDKEEVQTVSKEIKLRQQNARNNLKRLNKADKVIKRVVVVILVIAIIFSALMGFSFLFPGKAPVLDEVRLAIQSQFMNEGSDIIIGDLYLDENLTLVETPADISLKELPVFLDMLRPGDIFFTNSSRYMSSLVIPGDWKHAGIYLGTKENITAQFGEDSAIFKELEKHYEDGTERLILDSSSYGVKVREFKDLSNLEKKSYLRSLCAFRVNVNDSALEQFVATAMEQIGKDYDYDFMTDDISAFYCSELVYYALLEIDIELEYRSPYVNRDVVSPEDAVDFIIDKGVDNSDFSMLFSIEKNSADGKSFQIDDLFELL